MKVFNSLPQLTFIMRTFILATFAFHFGTASASTLSKDQILQDADGRIADEFSVPHDLRERTSFWFDIYTKYGSNEHVIHHVLYPWIVYKVVDTAYIFAGAGHRWTKHHAAEKAVAASQRQVTAALKALAKRKRYSRLKPLEKSLYRALSLVPGRRQRVFREAAANVRVQLGQRDFFKSGLASSRAYLPAIEKEFAARELPLELARLPFVESSFNVKAESKVGASGIWQIMPATGRMYLTVNKHIDERNSPLKASVAAAKILRSNFRALKDWPLAVTAYNHGTGGVRHALRQAGVHDLVTLIQRYHAGSFKFASANFYTSFLAALHAERYQDELFFDVIGDGQGPLAVHVVALEKPMPVRSVLRRLSLSADQLLEYNLDLKKALKTNARLPRGFRLMVPSRLKPRLEKDFAAGRKLFKSV